MFAGKTTFHVHCEWKKVFWIHNQTGFLACAVLRSRERLRFCMARKKIRIRSEGNEKLEKLQTIKTIEVLFSCKEKTEKDWEHSHEASLLLLIQTSNKLRSDEIFKVSNKHSRAGGEAKCTSSICLSYDASLWSVFVCHTNLSVSLWKLIASREQTASCRVKWNPIGHVYSLSKDCFGLISVVLWFLHLRAMHSRAYKVKQTRVKFPEVLLFGFLQNIFELL